jgi:hypothetical protein
MIRGTTFWRKDEDSPHLHLRFVLSEPDIDGTVLVVGMSRLRKNGREDLSCILSPGDHPQVHEESFIRYDHACALNYFKLIQEKMRGELTMVSDLAPAILKKIQNEAQKSLALPIKLKKYFTQF